MSQLPWGLKPSQMSDQFSSSPSSRVLVVFPCFCRDKRSLRPSGAQQPPGADPAPRAQLESGIRMRFKTESASDTQAASVRDVGAGCRSFDSGQGCSRCPLDLRRQRCCCNLTAPPPVTASTNHSPAGQPTRAPIGRRGCQSLKLLLAT